MWKNHCLVLVTVNAIALLMAASNAAAKAASVTCEYKYVLGDNDTKHEARKIAFVEAKRRCSEQIGTLLASETIVSSSDLTKDEIRAYSLSVMKTEVLAELFLPSGDGLAFLVKLKAHYDTDLVDARFKDLLSDRGRSKDFKQVQEQIVELEMQMASLQWKLAIAASNEVGSESNEVGSEPYEREKRILEKERHGILDDPKERGRIAPRLEHQGVAKRQDTKVLEDENHTISRAIDKSPLTSIGTALKISGLSGSNHYMTLIGQQITNAWYAPSWELSNQGHVVIVRFRIHRNGSVSGLEIEQSSGSVYYDLAGKRAVLSASPFPILPPDITSSYLDAKFVFRSSPRMEGLQSNNLNAPSPGIPIIKANSAFNSAYNDYLNGKDELAAAGFEGFIRDFRESPLRPNAYYYLGESHFNRREYRQAIHVFQQLLGEYPQSERIPTALYKLGLLFLERKDAHSAREHLKRLIQSFPSSEEAPLAQTKLHEMQ